MDKSRLKWWSESKNFFYFRSVFDFYYVLVLSLSFRGIQIILKNSLYLNMI